MPRLRPSLFRQAKRHSPHAATLLGACKDVPSALIELRWIREHVNETFADRHEHHVARLCGRRGRGEPLQYVLGSQPFGSLDIRCRPGVLIPRWETEAYAVHLARLLRARAREQKRAGASGARLNMIDFCTGTGCIPLLSFASLYRAYTRLSVRGVDVSPMALDLARANIRHNTATGQLPRQTDDKMLDIVEGDVFDDYFIEGLADTEWDVLVSNPPYVSRDVWRNGRGQLGPSVRKYEPKLALVPGDSIRPPQGVEHADVFYARLLDVAALLKPSLLLFEVGDAAQALRVAGLCHDHPFPRTMVVELWRDQPDLAPGEDEATSVEIPGRGTSVPVRGTGNIRTVLIRKGS